MGIKAIKDILNNVGPNGKRRKKKSKKKFKIRIRFGGK